MPARLLVALLVLAGAYGLLAAGALVRNRAPLLEPPGPWARLRLYLGHNVARTGQRPGFRELEPPCYGLPPHEVLEHAVAAMHALGWEVVEADPGARRVRAVVRTPWLRFRDDVTLRLHELPAGGTRLEAESRSRIGRADFAANQHHLRALIAALDARLPRLPPAPSPTAPGR